MSALLKSWEDESRAVHTGPVVESSGQFTVIDCECCRFKHVVPLPTPQELSDVYSHEYYTTEKPLYIERYLEDKEWWDVVYEDRYLAIEEFLGGRKGSMLDIGSGPGLFLAHGRDRGWQTLGVEPSAKASHYSQTTLGLDIRNIFLNTQTAPTLGKFDAINMGEVLEHLPDPAETLGLAKSLLNDGGVLCLIVPNDFNPIQKVLRDSMGYEPWWVAPPHHLNYFNHESLKGLVERAGFEVLRVESTFPIDMFLLMGENYVFDDAKGRRVHQWRKTLEANLISHEPFGRNLQSSLRNMWAKLGIGREVVIFARNS